MDHRAESPFEEEPVGGFPTATAVPVPRRLRTRFGLRSIILFMTFVGCLLAWIVKERQQSDFERQIANDLVVQGYRPLVLGLYDSLELHNNNQPQGWWRDLTRIVLGERIRKIRVDGNTMDLTPLAQLTKLSVLEASSTSVRDLTPLAGLSSLRELTIDSSWSLRDLSPLAGLTELERLHLSSPSLRDLSPLAGLTKLEYLLVNSPLVNDLAPLAQLTSLTELRIGWSSVDDLTPLAGLTNLRTLEVQSCAVRDDQVKALQNSLPNCSVIRQPVTQQ